MFERMLAAMQRGGRLRSESCIGPEDQWAVGRVHLGTLQPTSQLDRGDSVHVLFHGDLFNATELKKQLEFEAPRRQIESVPSLIRCLYRTYGSGFPSRLKGSFCAVVLDEALKRVVLINDYLGSYPLYWFSGPRRFVFAGELKAILRDPDRKFALDPRAVADYLTFGFIFGDKTLASQVKLLPPSSTMTYCWEDGKCRA